MELFAYTGYPFVPICLSQVAHCLLGRGGYYLAWGYGSLCMGMFMVKTIKRVMLQVRREYGLARLGFGGPGLALTSILRVMMRRTCVFLPCHVLRSRFLAAAHHNSASHMYVRNTLQPNFCFAQPGREASGGFAHNLILKAKRLSAACVLQAHCVTVAYGATVILVACRRPKATNTICTPRTPITRYLGWRLFNSLLPSGSERGRLVGLTGIISV